MTDLPPAGWYDDPSSPGTERWWTGQFWSEQTRPKLTPIELLTHGDLREFGDFLSHTFGLIRAAVSGLATMVLSAALLFGLLSLWFFRELDAAGVDLVDDDFVGWGGTQTVQLTAVLFLFLLIGLPAYLGSLRLLWHAAHDSMLGTWSAFRFGLATAPRFFLWLLAAMIPHSFLVGLLIASAGSAGTPNGLLVLLFVIPMTWWGIIVYLLPAATVTSRRGSNPIRVAINAQKGRWWRIFWRLVLIGVIMSIGLNVILAGVTSAVPDPGFGLGGAFLGMVILGLLFLLAYLPYWAGTVSILFDVMPEEDRELVGESAT